MKTFGMLLLLGFCTINTIQGQITGVNITETQGYQNQSYHATESIGLLDEFAVTTEGFEAIIITPPSLVGQWSAKMSWGFVAIHTHVLPTGQVLAWQGHNDNMFHDSINNPMIQGTHVYQWDPATSILGPADHTGSNIFCSGHSFLPDGRLLVTGGHDYTVPEVRANPLATPPRPYVPGYILGLNHANTFNFATNTWQSEQAMKRARWYPTNTTLANGDVLTISGETQPTQILADTSRWPEVWHNGAWRQLRSAWLTLPTYPWMFLASTGKVFYAGPGQDTRYLDPQANNGRGAWSVPWMANGTNQYDGYRGQGTAVMYNEGKILVIGGATNTGVTNTAQLIDLTGATPQFQMAAPMEYPRHHVNSTLLPDGTVLVTGGTRIVDGSDPGQGILPAELWTPPTSSAPGGTWQTVAAMSTPRLYHSTAVLLPDGRVLSAGGEEIIHDPFVAGQDNHPDAEVYSPPYLFKGARPSITSAPTSVSYGQSLILDTPDHATITDVTWIRLPSVTHSFNMNQRFNRLPITARSATGVTVATPRLANDCPPGHYLIFALRNGVPSEAKIVSISDNPCAATVALSTGVTTSTCSATAYASVSGTNIGANYHWSIDGVYDATYDGQISVSVQLSTCRPQVSFSVEVTPACGGNAIVDSQSISGGPFTSDGQFCACE